MHILLLSDIHGNYPALQAIEKFFSGKSFDHIINSGDSVVYAPFPNETLDWLRSRRAISVLGNTDEKVIKLLRGKTFKKPSKDEKRVMYTSTAAVLSDRNQIYLRSFPVTNELAIPSTVAPDSNNHAIGIFHGSPAAPNEFLFVDTPDNRFKELAACSPYPIIVTGHSHTPYVKQIDSTYFINPGSAGRMFDGYPSACCAVLNLTANKITVQHHRIKYDISEVVDALRLNKLPEIYVTMFRKGRKLN